MSPARSLKALLRRELAPPKGGVRLLLRPEATPENRYLEQIQRCESKLPPCRVVWIGDLKDWGGLYVAVLVERPVSEETFATTWLPLGSLRNGSVGRVLSERQIDYEPSGSYANAGPSPEFAADRWQIDQWFGAPDTVTVTPWPGHPRFASSPPCVVADRTAKRIVVIPSWEIFRYYYARSSRHSTSIGAAIRPPRRDDRPAERILDERRVFVLLDAVELHPRDHALIRLLYNGGLRVSEAVTLQRRNLVDGIVNVRGKSGRTRVVRLSRGTWAELQALRPADALGDDRVFPMTAWNAWDRVRRAARAAGIEALASPHFLRHSHGSHALSRRADLATVRETLGHASLTTTGRYLHARLRNPAAIISPSDRKKKLKVRD